MAYSRSKASKPSKVVKPRKATRRSTESHRNHRFQSFSERISKLKIDPIRRRRNVEDRDELAEDAATYFGRSLTEWRDLNMSQSFASFAKDAALLCDSLPMVLHNEDRILDLLLHSIQQGDAMAMEPLLSLLSRFAHDLDARFERHFQRAVSTVAGVAAKHPDPAVVEWSFTCLAWLFKYLSRLLAPDLRPVYDLMSPYMGKVSQKTFIIRFAAESMSFLVRKAAASSERDTAPLDLIVGHILHDCEVVEGTSSADLYTQGVMTLLTEAIKGVQRGIHSTGPAILRSLVQHARRKPSTTNSSVLAGTITSLIHFTDDTTFRPVFDAVLGELSDFDERPKDDYALLASEMLFVMVSVRKGTRISDWKSVFDCISRLVSAGSNTSGWSSATRSRLLSALAIALQTAPLDAALPALPLLNAIRDTNWASYFLQFSDYFARLGNDRFVAFVLPRFQEQVSKTREEDIDDAFMLLPRLLRRSPTTKLHCSTELQVESVRRLELLLDAESSSDSEALLLQCCHVLEAIRFLHLPAQTKARLAELLLENVEKCLRSASGTRTTYNDFGLGLCLQTWLQLDDRPDVLESLLPKICVSSTHFSNFPRFWQNVSCIVQRSDIQTVDEGMVEHLKEALICGLSLPSHETRSHVLDIMQTLYKGTERGVSEALSTAILIESTPLNLETSRSISMNIRRLGAGYSQAATDHLLSRAVPTYCFGLMHVRLAQAWTDATEALAQISKSPTGEEVLVSIAQEWLERPPEDAEDSSSSPPQMDVDSQGFQVRSDFECSNLVKLEAIAKEAFQEPQSGTRLGDQELKTVTARVPRATHNARNQALRVLDKIPHIAEKRSRLLVPVLLRWAASNPVDDDGAPTTSSWSRKDQKAMLTVFSRFTNPKVLHRSGEVYGALLNLCANGDVEIQQAALKALLAWKNPDIARYEEHLKNLLDDSRFREEVSVFLQGDAEEGLRPPDFPSVMPVLLRLLYGRLVGGGKDGQHARRKAVFIALSRFDLEVIEMFVDISLSSIKDIVASENGQFREEARTEIKMPLRQQLGMLNMVGDMLETLGSLLRPLARKLLDAILLCTVIATRQLDQCSSGSTQAQDLSLHRSVRQNGLQCLARLFASMGDLEVDSQCTVILHELMAPRLENFAAENAQGVSSTLRLMSAWSVSPRYAARLWDYNDQVLDGVAQVLRLPGAKDDVKLFVLQEIIDPLLADSASQGLPIRHSISFVGSIGQILKAQPGTEVLEACVRTIMQLADRITDPEQGHGIIRICAGLLTQPGKFVSPATKHGILRTVLPLLDLAGMTAEPDLYNATCGLFSRLRASESREVLSAVFFKLCGSSETSRQAALICQDLNAGNAGRLNEPDHARREQGFIRIYECAGRFTKEQWLPILHNCLFFIRDETDAVNRSSASKALELFIGVSREDEEVLALMKTDLFPAIERGMKERSELVRAEYLRLLGRTVQEHTDWSEVTDLRNLIVSEDDESSFFTNALHIQQHSRLQALRRLGDESKISSRNVSKIFLPLLEHFIFDQAEGDSGRTLADQTVQTIGRIAKRLRWSEFRSTLLRYYSYLKTKEGLEKTVLRLIGALIDGLNPMVPSLNANKEPHPETTNNDLRLSTVGEGETMPIPPNRAKVIMNEYIPPLAEYLHRKDESTVDRRVAVAVSIVKLARHLPDTDFVSRLAPTLTDITHILKSRDLEAREQTRKTLSAILSLVGPTYLGFIIKELRSALQRGYQLHVLSFTVHHLLVTNGKHFQPGDLDACLPELTAIIMDDIFGVTGQEKDAEEYKSGMKEIKSSKSFDTLEILARMATIPRLGQLIAPIRALLQEKVDAKMVRKIDELLIRVRRGVDQNPAAESRDLLIFCHEIVRQVYSQQADSTVQNALQSWRLKKYLSKPKANTATSKKGATTFYSFKLVAFALNLVRKVVRRHDDLQTPANMAGFLPMLGDGLVAGEQDVKVEAAKLLSTIIRVPLPQLTSDVPVFFKEAIAMVKSSPSTTDETARAGLELITAILREKRDVEVNERDIAYLLKALKADLDEPDRQGVIFRFLRAVLGRKIVITEVYDVLDEVARMMIANPDETVRQSARAAYVQFVLEFPQGKDRWAKTTGFLIKNLAFEHAGGRKSVLEVIHVLLARLGDEVVQEVLLGLLVGLVPRIVGDVDAGCREMATLLVGRVFERADEERGDAMKGMMSKWLRNDKKTAIRRAAVACWTICVRSEKVESKEMDMLVGELTRNVKLETSSDDANDSNLLSGMLTLLTAMCETTPMRAFAPDTDELWVCIQGFVTAVSVEVQEHATKLLNILFNNIASNMSKSEGGLTATTLRASAGLELDQDRQRRLCALHLRALRKAPEKASDLVAHIVRTLVFFGRVFAANGLEWSSGREDKDEEQDEVSAGEGDPETAERRDKRDTTALGFLLAGLASAMRRENASLLTRHAAIQAAAALISIIPPPIPNLALLLRPLYVLTDPSIPQPPGDEYKALIDKARELLDLVQRKVGAEVYVKMLGEARKGVNERRDERRRKRKVDAVSQPERWAREKRRKHETKKASSKAKAELGRAKRRGWMTIRREAKVRAGESASAAQLSAQFTSDALCDAFACPAGQDGHAKTNTAASAFASSSSLIGPFTSSPDSEGALTPSSQTSAADTMSSAFDALTHGCLRRINNSEHVDQPIVQCLQIKPMGPTAQGGERYRVVWNDTENFIQSMITQQASWVITEGHLKRGSVCRLKSYQANQIKDKMILVVLDLDILNEFGEPDKLGTAAPLDAPKQAGVGGADSAPQTDNIAGKNFYGQQNQPQQQQQQQPQRALPSRSNGASHGNIYPIEALSPYAHKWTIKARCTHKAPIKTWHKASGEGKLFSVNFLDESGEIRATGFNDSVDQWYEFLQEGNVYYLSSPCRVSLAKKQFSNVSNDYELTFERDTAIEKADDMEGVPQVRYNFTTLSDLQNVEKDTTIDCIGVLQDVGEVSEIISKTTSKPYTKRELTLVDNTGFNVRLTIWGNSAQTFDSVPESVLAFKGVKVSDFGGRSLSLLSSGSMSVNPDIEEAFKLKGWYQAEGAQHQFQSHANTIGTASATSGGRSQEYKTVAQVGEENLGMNATGDADWFSLKATILYVKKENVAYPACRSEGCNKKVIESMPGEWRCEKCDKTYDSPEWRYVMSINVGDHTGQLWLSCFNETGVQIMGMSADELQAIRDEEGSESRRAEVLFADATCKTFVFRCKAKMDNFQDQQRVRYQVQSAAPLNFAAEANKLASIIKTYSINDDGLFVN